MVDEKYSAKANKESDFFNPKVKMQYLETVNKNYCVETSRRFKCFAEVERNFNKDLFDFSYEEMLYGLASLEYISYRTLRTDMSKISLYIEWAQLNNITFNTGNVIKNINLYDVSFEKTIKSRIFTSAQELILVIREIMENSCRSIDDMTLPLVCLLWDGLDLKEIINLKTVDINFENGLILGKYKITPDFIPILKHYMTVEAYSISYRDYNTVYEKIDRGAGGYYIQAANQINSAKIDSDVNLKKLQNLLYSVSKSDVDSENTKSICAKDINLSGLLFRLKELQNSGTSVEDNDIIREFKIVKTPTVTDKIFTLSVKDYRMLFKSYMRVFGK